MTANYAITGVWFKENKKGSEHISHVMIHEILNNSILTGVKKTKDEVLTILRTKTISTLKWDYKEGNWKWGARITSETRNLVHYLRTVPDGDVTNNLDNIINMTVLPL